MKIRFLHAFGLTCLLAALFVCMISQIELEKVYASPYTDIDVNTALNMITNGSFPDLVILDVRTQSEYDAGHIYRAVLIPHTELKARIGELEGHEDHEIIVYCRSGVRSVNASKTLDSFNFTKVYNMLEGILGWELMGYPIWIATVHNLNTTFNYDTIQAAIDAPQTLNGHTIFAEKGIYYEHVIVNKTLSLLGEDREGTIVDGNGTGAVVSVTKSNVIVSQLTIRNGSVAIKLDSPGVSSCNNTAILDNSITSLVDGGTGVLVVNSYNNSITGNTISDNWIGINLGPSYSNIITSNIISKNRKKGVASGLVIMIVPAQSLRPYLGSPNANQISENIIVDNACGVNITNRSGEVVFHNNFVNNTVQAYVLRQYGVNVTNLWDNGCEGNYWSDYAGIDLDPDGIGDSSRQILENNSDHYPLMGMLSNFNATPEHDVKIVCNSTIQHFQFNGTAIIFNVTGENSTFGFCRICIPIGLMNETYTIYVNGAEVEYNLLKCPNTTHNYLYFTYCHSTKEIVIIPDFSSAAMPILIIGTLIATLARNWKPSLQSFRIVKNTLKRASSPRRHVQGENRGHAQHLRE